MRALLAPALVLTLLSPIGLSACATTSVDPAIRADLDRRLSQLPTSPETYPPSESFLPMAFSVGQWTQHRLRDDKGAQLITNRLVDRDPGGYWLETVIESYAGTETVRMHVAMLGGRDPGAMEIRELRIKKGDTPTLEVLPGDIPKYRDEYQRVLDLLAVSFESDMKDDVRVPGGHFIGCYKFETGRPWGPWQRASNVCVHPSVPLSGVVRAVPPDATGALELVGFGTANEAAP